LVPEQFSTIQAAIDASATGDTVLIGPGTYRGDGNRGIEFRGRDLIVKSREGPDETVIDCERMDRGFYLHEWETRASRIEGLTIQHGYAGPGTDMQSGGGVFCGLSDPTIVDCRILECQAGADGGGLALIVFSGVVDGCVISGCVAERGGGIWFMMGEAEIENCVITGNGGAQGGGVCFGGPGPNRLAGCTVSANWAGEDGGGILAINPLFLERCIIWDNCSWTGVDEIWCWDADMACSDIDTTGVRPHAPVNYDAGCIYIDPRFCLPVGCGWTTEGDWSLDASSLCLAENSPCGQLIGALGQGCGGPTPTGACCFPDGSCRLLQQSQCEDEQGSYMGDVAACEPNPCHPTPVETTSWGRLKARFRHGGR
jgi:hypothetical protein